MSLAIPVGKDDHVLGPADAPVTLVEYGDYQCPACAAAHPMVKVILKRLGAKLRFVFRNMPLSEIHPYAELAAEAAEAAAKVCAAAVRPAVVRIDRSAGKRRTAIVGC